MKTKWIVFGLHKGPGKLLTLVNSFGNAQLLIHEVRAMYVGTGAIAAIKFSGKGSLVLSSEYVLNPASEDLGLSDLSSEHTVGHLQATLGTIRDDGGELNGLERGLRGALPHDLTHVIAIRRGDRYSLDFSVASGELQAIDLHFTKMARRLNLSFGDLAIYHPFYNASYRPAAAMRLAA